MHIGWKINVHLQGFTLQRYFQHAGKIHNLRNVKYFVFQSRRAVYNTGEKG